MSKTFLWVTNGSSACGGTVWATGDMIRALPDCQHVVLALSGKFDEASRAVLGQDTLLLNRGSVDSVVRGLSPSPDVIVYQNTKRVAMSVNKLDGTIEVLYAHSLNRDYRLEMQHCDLSLSVSHCLSAAGPTTPQDVLWQPVSLPPVDGSKLRARYDGLRLCSAHPAKWALDDSELAVNGAVREWQKGLNIDRAMSTMHLVGAPNNWVGQFDQQQRHDVSLDARKLFAECGFFLYTNTTFPESYGRVVREAQLRGCVPIVADCGGFREQIQHGLTGFLVKSAEGVRLALESLFGNSENYLGSWRIVSDYVASRAARECSPTVWRKGFLSYLSKV